MELKVKPVSLTIWLAILSTSLYVVANNLPPGLGSFRFFWGPLTLIIILLTKPRVYTKKPMIYLILFGFISLILLQYTLWKYMNDWNRSQILNEYYPLVVFTAILYYFVTRNDYKGLAKVGKISFYFIIVTIIMTHIALVFDPYIVRQSANPEKFSSFQSKIFNLTGATGYGYAQALVFLIPILVYHIKFSKKMIFSKKTLIVILLLILFLQVRAQVFANLLVALFITIVSFIGAKKAKRSYVIIGLFFIFVLLIPASFYADVLVSVSSHFDADSNIYYKLIDFAKFIKNPELSSSTGAGLRASRYSLLFRAFISKPILGDASYNSPFYIMAGGHLYWMNRLTQWGILGFLFFVLIFSQIYKSVLSLFDKSFGFYYFLSVSAFVLFGLMKNITGREPFLILILVIPGMYFLPLLDHKKKDKIKEKGNLNL